MKKGCENKEITKRRSVALPVIGKPNSQLAEISHSKTGKWRAAALIGLTLLMIAHIIQWRMMGQTISPIEPSEAMYTLQNGAINAGFIFFSLAILATLIFGRFVCGWGCHIVALQDFCGWLLKKIGLTPKAFRSRLLVYVPIIVAFYMFVYPTAVRFLTKPKNEPLIPQFTNHLITSNFWETFPSVAVAIPFLFICGFVTVYFLGQKGFCTYACPYGGVFGLADKIAPGKIRVTDACNQCGHCTATCTSNVLVHAEVKEFGMVVDPGCMKCMDCVSVCPNDALYFGFGKPAVSVPKPKRTNYSLSWTEEVLGAIAFLAGFLAVWDVYQLVPMLMALGIAAVTAFLVLKIWKIAVAKDTAFYKFNLKSAGRIQKAGWLFLCFAIPWVGLNAHSGFIRYHESAGARAFESIRIPDELALAQKDPAEWLGQNDFRTINEGKRHLQAASKYGLFVNSEVLPKLAWFEYLSGDANEAVDLLGKAAEHQHGQGKALSLYYRGAILNRLGRREQALKSLGDALAIRSDLLAAREEKGVSLWQLGRKAEAIFAWREAAQSATGAVLSNNFLAGAAASEGLSDAADAFEKEADKVTPADPFFHWMLALRLKDLGMDALAEKHFTRAIQLNPAFRSRKR